jgi:hypothetical protein
VAGALDRRGFVDMMCLYNLAGLSSTVPRGGELTLVSPRGCADNRACGRSEHEQP